MPALTLISKPECHLCDDARTVIADVVAEFEALARWHSHLIGNVNEQVARLNDRLAALEEVKLGVRASGR